MNEFTKSVQELEEQMEARGNVVEEGKLAVVGQRNVIQGEDQAIRVRKAQLEARIAEKEAELDRVIAEGSSLQAVIHKQDALLEKLSNNEA